MACKEVHISNAVISKSLKTIAELLEAARIVELTAQPDLSLPAMQQLNELRADNVKNEPAVGKANNCCN